MNPESRDPQELNQAAGITVPAIGNNTADDLPFYRIPTPPVPGKTAWSLSPWLPE
jgi:hypothetical protein